MNMITVPCCTQCQSNQKGDDEYFRTFLSASLGSSRTKSGQSALNKVSREHQIRRDRSPGVKSYFQPQLKPVINHDGKLLGYLPQGTVDVKRIEKICWRIHRGLIYHRYKQLLPEAKVDFQMQIVNATTVLFEGVEEAIRIQNVTYHPSLEKHRVGDGEVCNYEIIRANDHPFNTMTRTSYYNSVLVISTTLPLDHPRFEEIQKLKEEMSS